MSNSFGLGQMIISHHATEKEAGEANINIWCF